MAAHLEDVFSVDTEKLRGITDHFVSELSKGLSKQGGSLPMNATWCIGKPTGREKGSFLTVDMGGTNIRVCEVKLLGKDGAFETVQTKYKIPTEMKQASIEILWDFIADCLRDFLAVHRKERTTADRAIPLGFTFSYPVMQNYIDHGVLQRWTKGFDIAGVEGTDVVPSFRAALRKWELPIELVALVNDTTGTLMAAAYADPSVQVGCIFATGCNAAYMENCANIERLPTNAKADPSSTMAINCEWGAFDNEKVVLPRTRFDEVVDAESPRPGQQCYEKMISGFYLGEIYRLALLELIDDPAVALFKGRKSELLRAPYSVDTALLAVMESDTSANFQNTADIFRLNFDITLTGAEVRACRHLAEIIGTRSARLSACGVAALCKKNGWKECHVAADGSVFSEYPGFKARMSQALSEIFGWPEGSTPIEFIPARDGSGVGAAVIVASTLNRVKEGNHLGIADVESTLKSA